LFNYDPKDQKVSKSSGFKAQDLQGAQGNAVAQIRFRKPANHRANREREDWMTPPQISEIQARLKAISPGAPWIVERTSTHNWIGSPTGDGKVWVIVFSNERGEAFKPEVTPRNDANADFIAHAPTDMAALDAEVKRLSQRERELVREAKRAEEWSNANESVNKEHLETMSDGMDRLTAQLAERDKEIQRLQALLDGAREIFKQDDAI
jgi:hypothetical protein